MKLTYQHLVELVDGDDELVAHLVEEGEITCGANDVAIVDVERVLIAHTLVRELEIDWAGLAVILRLRDELAEARRRIAELEAR